MSKEKQIEEMAQIIRNRLPHIGRLCSEGECINGDKNSVYETPCWCVYKEIAEMLYNTGYRKQSEDTVEVVRCKDCEHHHWEQEPCHGKTVHKCSVLNAEVFKDFYCYYGKSKMKDNKVNENPEEIPKKHFTPEDVRKMSRAEVRENYSDIIASMKKWN